MKTWFGFALAFSLSQAQVLSPFQVDFEGHPLGTYTEEMAQEDFPPPASDYWYYGMEQGRSSLVADGEGQALRVAYPAGCLGPNDDPLGCGMQIKWTLPESAKSLWASYRVKFEEGFDFRRGGKLPGLCGGKCYTGGHIPQKGDGWSARLMWRPGGKVVQYMYFVDQAGTYGDDMPWTLGGSERSCWPEPRPCAPLKVPSLTPSPRPSPYASASAAAPPTCSSAATAQALWAPPPRS